MILNRLWLFVVLLVDNACCNQNFDRFNYDNTVTTSEYTDYGPEDWGKVSCPDQTTCLGWPETWEYGVGWSITRNHCKWCPDNRCGTHHQSPINVDRDVAIQTSDEYNECIDVHWMAYKDSTCSFEQLREQHAMFVDRHALRIVQPVKYISATDKYKLDCDTGGQRFGRIDFSKGFSHWWHLSHIDIHTPSEHTQKGKRYDAELQMHHFYSVSGEEAGIDNELGSVAIFLQAYDDANDWDVLNRLICAWRESEEMTRSDCDLPSVTTEYPGCLVYNRQTGDSATTQNAARALSIHDVLLRNGTGTIKVDFGEVDDNDNDDFDFDTFLEIEKRNEKKKSGLRRDLINYKYQNWFNYFPMLAVRTEYYYRYSGSQTIPPCYGNWFPNNNRKQTNHWRVMKDPIRISNRQLNEMHRLQRERIAPKDDPVASCTADTAGKIVNGKVNNNRPLQSNHKAHYTVFCECENWKSKWPEEQEWCKKYTRSERFNDHPYNFYTNGY